MFAGPIAAALQRLLERMHLSEGGVAKSAGVGDCCPASSLCLCYVSEVCPWAKINVVNIAL